MSYETENDVELTPVIDWSTDWDSHDPAWRNNPFPIWDELRQTCPVAHTERYNEGVWLPTRFDDITAIAHDTAHPQRGRGVPAGLRRREPVPERDRTGDHRRGGDVARRHRDDGVSCGMSRS